MVVVGLYWLLMPFLPLPSSLVGSFWSAPSLVCLDSKNAFAPSIFIDSNSQRDGLALNYSSRQELRLGSWEYV